MVPGPVVSVVVFIYLLDKVILEEVCSGRDLRQKTLETRSPPPHNFCPNGDSGQRRRPVPVPSVSSRSRRRSTSPYRPESSWSSKGPSPSSTSTASVLGPRMGLHRSSEFGDPVYYSTPLRLRRTLRTFHPSRSQCVF